DGVSDAAAGADVLHVRPGVAAVARDGHDRVIVVVGEAEVDAAALGDGHGGVAVRGHAVRHFPHAPGRAVVLGDDDALLAAAVLVRHVSRAVRPHFDVAVQAAALLRGVDRHGRAERGAAVEGDRAVGQGDV